MIFFLYFFIFSNNQKKCELNKAEICTLTLYLSREVTKKKLIVTQSWYDSIKRVFKFYTQLFLEMDAKLTGLFLFNFEITPCKNHSDTNLVKIH